MEYYIYVLELSEIKNQTYGVISNDPLITVSSSDMGSFLSVNYGSLSSTINTAIKDSLENPYNNISKLYVNNLELGSGILSVNNSNSVNIDETYITEVVKGYVDNLQPNPTQPNNNLTPLIFSSRDFIEKFNDNLQILGHFSYSIIIPTKSNIVYDIHLITSDGFNQPLNKSFYSFKNTNDNLEIKIRIDYVNFKILFDSIYPNVIDDIIIMGMNSIIYQTISEDDLLF